MSSKLDTNTVPGYIDHLGIITDQRPNPGEISITENGFVYLPYDKETDDEIVTLLNNSSQFRSIKCSELTRALSAKSYFREGLSYAENDNTFKIKLNPKALGGGEVPTIIHPISQDVSKFSDGIEFTDEQTLSTADVISIGARYSSLYEGNDRVGFDFMISSANNGVDLVNNRPFTITLISGESDVYTDTINFNGIIRHSVGQDLSGSVNLDVRYSMNSGKIYSGNIVFSVFNYDQNLTLESKNFIQDINSKVQAEFIDGVFKIYPMDPNVTECIINNCILTYAKS